MTKVPLMIRVLCTLFITSAFAAAQKEFIITGAKETPVELECDRDTHSYTWTLNGNIMPGNTSYIYEITDPTAVGKYFCSSNNAILNNTFIAINFTAPYIEHTSKSITVTEGDVNAALVCHSNSYTDPTFHWILHKDGVDPVNLSESAGPTYSILSEGKKSTLTISTVTGDNRANYECFAYNNAGNGTASVLVRVHGKLAPLWPFLGIVIEVLLLAIFMLIVARRNKDKAALQLAPADSQNPPGSAEHSGTRRHSGKEE